MPAHKVGIAVCARTARHTGRVLHQIRGLVPRTGAAGAPCLSIPEIAGRELACECAPGQPCHADYLATQARMPLKKFAPAVRRRGRPLPQLVMASLVVPAAAWYPGDGEVQQRWPQYGLDRAIRSLFPHEWTQGIAMPNLEDLVNAAPFTCYAEYLQGIGQEPDGPLGPTIMTSYTRGQRRLAEGDQRGSFRRSGTGGTSRSDRRCALLCGIRIRPAGKIPHERGPRS